MCNFKKFIGTILYLKHPEKQQNYTNAVIIALQLFIIVSLYESKIEDLLHLCGKL